MYCIPLLHLNLNGKSNGTETKFKFNGALLGNKHMEHTVRVPHDENPQELFYIIKLTQIHDAESAWRYSKEYRSCRQIAFIHGDVHDDGWMREYSITLKNDVEKILFQCRSIMLYSAHTTVRYWQYKYKYT